MEKVKEERAAPTPDPSVVSPVIHQIPKLDSSSSAFADSQQSQQPLPQPLAAEDEHVPATPTNSDASDDDARAGPTKSKGKGKGTTRTTSRETLAAQADGKSRPSSTLPSQEQPERALVAESSSNASHARNASSPHASHRAPSLPPVLPSDAVSRTSPRRSISPSPSNSAAEEARKAQIRAGKQAMSPSPAKERRSSDASMRSWAVGLNEYGIIAVVSCSPRKRGGRSPSKAAAEDEEEMEVDEGPQESGTSGAVTVESQQGATANDDDDEVDESDESMVKAEPKASQSRPPATGQALKAHSSSSGTQPTHSTSTTSSYPSNASPSRALKPSLLISPGTTRRRKSPSSSPPPRESPRWDHSHKRARFADDPVPSASAPLRSVPPNALASSSRLPPPPATQPALHPPPATQPLPASQAPPSSQRPKGRKSLSAEEKARLLRSLPREMPPENRSDRESRWHIWLRLPNEDQGPNSAAWPEKRRKRLYKIGAMGMTGVTLGRTMSTVFEDAVNITGWSMRDLRLRWTPLLGEEGEEPEEGDEAMIWGFDTLLHEFRDLEEAGMRSESIVDVDHIPFKKERLWSDWD